MSGVPIHLPVDIVLPDLIHALRQHGNVVLKAPPGAGKTTRVPPALLQAGMSGQQRGQIVMLEPRRIAARTAARRIASERNERVGQTAGYRIRFEEAVGPDTRIVVVTEGVLLRRLLDDPFLDGVDVVIFDEFHERRLDSDLALAMTRRIQQTVRPDLNLVVMSATLDPQPIAAYLGVCPVIESEGRLHPVRIEYLRRPERQSMISLAVAGVERVLERTEGDVLVFLPGVGEILKTQRELEAIARRQNLLLLPLYGDLSSEDQDQVLLPREQRKVVLSTNVAETSVTIPGITAVVDTGFVRQMQFDADVGLDRLELMPISRAAADQRAGRAGRTQPGICLRLWEESAHRRRPESETAELHRVDLSSAVLRLRAWGENDVAAFPWFESPPVSSVEHADRLLCQLGAVDDHGVTDSGSRMVRLPVAPRIARLLMEGERLGQGSRCATLAALLSERDPFSSNSSSNARPTERGRLPHTVAEHRSRSDVLDRLTAFEQFIKSGRTESHLGTINMGAARMIQRAADQLGRSLAALRPAATDQLLSPTGSAALSLASDEAILRSLVVAFPDRVAKRREVGSDKGLMVGGRGVRLAPRSAVRDSLLFLCVDIDGRGVDAMVRQASEVLPEWLPEMLLRTGDELFFHPSQKQVVARRRSWFDDLLLDETPAAVNDPQQAAEILFKSACRSWSAIFPDDAAVKNLLTRIRCLAEWMAEVGLPTFDQEMLDDVLREVCQGRRSFAELQQAPWLATIQSRLDYQQLQLVEREAPEKLQVPGGNRIRLVYEQGRPPVLPVRIQEVFGWKQTPRIAAGRVPVLLHLLAPNMRPQQITDDLASFWSGAYQQVRKELKRRYPKHAWPEDPTTAQ